MKISGDSYRILKYLKSRRTDTIINENELIRIINCQSRDDLRQQLAILENLELIVAEIINGFQEHRLNLMEIFHTYLREGYFITRSNFLFIKGQSAFCAPQQLM